MHSVEWMGHSFIVYDLHNTTWNPTGGVYVFARLVTGLKGVPEWDVLYVGQTSSFQSRIPNHEVLPAALHTGATHVLALSLEKAPRVALEKRLIEYLHPQLNG